MPVAGVRPEEMRREKATPRLPAWAALRDDVGVELLDGEEVAAGLEAGRLRGGRARQRGERRERRSPVARDPRDQLVTPGGWSLALLALLLRLLLLLLLLLCLPLPEGLVGAPAFLRLLDAVFLVLGIGQVALVLLPDLPLVLVELGLLDLFDRLLLLLGLELQLGDLLLADRDGPVGLPGRVALLQQLRATLLLLP